MKGAVTHRHWKSGDVVALLEKAASEPKRLSLAGSEVADSRGRRQSDTVLITVNWLMHTATTTLAYTRQEVEVPSVRLKAKGSVECVAHRMESGKWLGQCEALGIFIEADDLNDLHGQFQEAIALFIHDLLDEGELGAFLKAQGWTMGNDWEQIVARKDPADIVPWYMIAPGQPDAFAREVA